MALDVLGPVTLAGAAIFDLGQDRGPGFPGALMMSLHIWALSHGIASLFGRGDAGRRKLPMSPEQLLEAGVLVYLRGLGIIETEEPAAPN